MEKIKIESKFADQTGEIMVVELGGHVDQSNTFQLQKMFENIIQSGCYKVIVDFKELYYMSSAGWGVFVGEIKRFRENGGDIKLAAMNSEIFEVYQMLEFYHILDDYPTVKEAALSFGKKSDELDFVLDNKDVEEIPEIPVESKPDNIKEINLVDSAETGKNEPEVNTEQKQESAEIIEFTPDEEQEIDFERKGLKEFTPHTLKKDVKLAELPISEKVKRVIAENPLIGVFGIKRILRHEHFGQTRVGVFRILYLLRELNLNTKEKRYRYYRSC